MTTPIDPDLPTLEGLLRSLLAEREAHEPKTATPAGPDATAETELQLHRRFRRALDGGEETPRSQLQELLTDACAERFALELARLRAKRRLLAAVADFSAEAMTADELKDLSSRYRLLEERIERLAEMIAGVRARLAGAPGCSGGGAVAAPAFGTWRRRIWSVVCPKSQMTHIAERTGTFHRSRTAIGGRSQPPRPS